MSFYEEIPKPGSGGGGGGSGGVSSVGTFSGSPQPDGATISGSAITFGPASSAIPGMLSTGSQNIGGAKNFSSAPTFSAGGNFNLSGGTQTRLTRTKAGVDIMDSDTYLSRPGIDFYAGNTPTLVAELDDSQFIISTHVNLFPDNTYDIGPTYKPRDVNVGRNFTCAGFTSGAVFCGTGIQFTASTANFTVNLTISTVIVDPVAPGPSQTITMPSAALNGQFIYFAFGTNGIVSLTIAANSGQTVIGGTGLAGAPATPIGFVYRSANTTWYRCN